MLKKNKIYDITLVILIIIENLFLFYFNTNNITNQTVNSFGCFFTSILIGIVVIKKYYKTTNIIVTKKSTGKYNYLLFLSNALILLVTYKLTNNTIRAIDYFGWSDIIPTVRKMAQRFLTGEFVYGYKNWASAFTNGTHPGYLTMHWFPFTLAEYLHKDARNIPFFIWSIGALIIMIKSRKCKDTWLHVAIPGLLLFSYYLMNAKIPSIIGVTIEVMVAGYYMLFITGLNQKNFFFTSLFMAFCILSRYYIMFWLPLWLFVSLVSGNKTYAIKITISVLVLILLLFIIPFASKDWSILNIFDKGYEIAAFGEWNHLSEKGLPYHLFAGNGFAYLFYEKYVHTDLNRGFKLLKTLLLVVPLLSTLIMGIWYWFNKIKINNIIFLMASFKVYLTFFLSFILVPYSYLMVPSVFVSIALFAAQASYQIVDNSTDNSVVNL